MILRTIRTIPAFLLLSSAVCAQSSERDSVEVRNNCRLASQILLTGRPDPHTEWARTQISFCEMTGATMLATVWSRATDDATELERLVYDSQRFRDKRLLDSVSVIARDGARTVAVRVAALRTLVGYYAPSRDLPSYWADSDALSKGCELTSGTHFIAVEGSEPLDLTSRAAILGVVRQLQDGSGPMSLAAKCALRGMELAG